MRLTVLKSKLHLATVTRSELYYHGSLTIDPDREERHHPAPRLDGLERFERLGVGHLGVIGGGRHLQ